MWKTAGNFLRHLARRRPVGWHPLLAVYYLTYACEFRCPYCADGSGTPYHALRCSILREQDLDRLFGRLRRVCDHLIVTGGEPTRHPDFAQFLRLLPRHRFDSVVLTTIGHDLDACLDDIARSIRYLVFSLDTLDAAKADAWLGRGPGCHAQILGNIETARRHPGKRYEVVISFLEKDGTKPEKAGYSSYVYYPSGLVADLEGNLYFVAQDGVFSVDPNGKQRWRGGDGATTSNEFTYYAPPVLSPDGVTYAVTSNQRLFALNTADGRTLWSLPAPRDQCCASRAMGGGGSALFVSLGSTRTDAVDRATGAILGTFVNPGYGGCTWPWGNWVLGWDFGIADSSYLVFDTCGSLKWPRGTAGASGVVAQGELLVVAPDTNGPSLTLYGADGSVATGPVAAEGRPLAAGSDGAIYTVTCGNTTGDGGTPQVDSIVAYSLDLKELWRFALGGNGCLGMTGNVVLDDDGVMCLVRSSPSISGTQVMAIQTRSPGLADSSWPSWRHDNRGTAWLVPGIATSVGGDGGAVVDPVDAPEQRKD